VAVGVRERPPLRRVGVVDDHPAGGERSLQTLLDHVTRSVDVEVGPAAQRLVDGLEPDERPASIGVEQHAVAHFAKARRRLPERQRGAGIRRGDGEHEVLHPLGLGTDVELARRQGDLRGERGILRRQAARRVSEQPHAHSGVAHVDVGVVIGRLGEVGDRREQLRARREAAGAEQGEGSGDAGTPVLDTREGTELV
jgi:hypothetical protein